MKHVSFAHNGKLVEVKTQANVLQALLVEQVPVKMACGGRGLCATCHVFVEKGADGLTPRTKKEERTLGLVGDATACSRLACQAQVLKDGVVVRLPKGLYIERTADLDSYIGKRAEVPLLHPVNGRILVEEGKIITRSVLVKLSSVDGDVQRMLANVQSTG